ncbi:hypothetical protein BGZ61DRAFT_487277 [Ilyonectria robusta]|uniref:uncharacterized protein n=1 Tax=Ilyonectria robusta TaxID=1079257 RepID=UPI001E8E4682|nr:uncharacterized protein BGZ61DRAFT_487277 [Ilyonectria robusta]KAH8653020.1 hypothetical protein BGZ61DRAFT_487277 [Ilyonectria robusta]
MPYVVQAEQMSWTAPKSMLVDMTSPLTLTTTNLQELTLNDNDLPQVDLIDKRIKLVEKIRKRTEIAKEYLQSSFVTELTESLRIAGVIVYHKEFIKAFEEDGYIAKDGDEGLSMDVLLCQIYLRELDGWLEGRVADLEHDEDPKNIIATTGGRRRRRRLDMLFP